MNYIILEKARPHKYIRREGTPGKYAYFYQELSKPGIEYAPKGIPEIEKYRKQAKNRLKEWREGDPLTGRKIPDEQILWEGYKWRDWVRKRGSAWEWAMWEEIQKFAKEKGFEYKEKITKQELLDNPIIPDVEGSLGKEYSAKIDEETTVWRNQPRPGRMWKFISSEDGKHWSLMSKRELWGLIKLISDKDIEENYPGLAKLKTANSWEEALNTDIEIFRGIPKEKEEPYIGRKFISYTVVPAIADKFARGYFHSYDAGEGKGIVVKRKVKFGDIIGYVNNDGENEVLVKPPKGIQHEIIGEKRQAYRSVR